MVNIHSIMIGKEVIDAAPAYVRIVVQGLGPASPKVTPPDVAQELARAVAQSAAELRGVEDFTALPAIAPWREAFRALGMNPSKFRSSVEALIRRAARSELGSLGSSLIDIGTIATLRCQVPVGVHVLDEVGQADLVLGPARSGDTFTLLDGSVDNPDHGEIVYRAGATVLTRRWVWRQGLIGSIVGDPRLVAVNIDLIEGRSYGVEEPERLITELLERCGVRVIGAVRLDKNNPSAQLSPW